MAAVRQQADLMHPMADGGVGGIDDPQRGLAMLDQRQRGAHVLGAGQARAQRLPLPQRFQRLARIDARGHVVGVADGQASIAAGGGEALGHIGDILGIADTGVQLAGAGRDQRETVAQQVVTAGDDDAGLLLQPVHPALIGRQIQLRRSPIGQLTRQGRGRGVDRHDVHVGETLVARLDGIQRIMQRGGGHDTNLGALVCLNRRGQQCQHQRGRQAGASQQR